MWWEVEGVPSLALPFKALVETSPSTAQGLTEHTLIKNKKQKQNKKHPETGQHKPQTWIYQMNTDLTYFGGYWRPTQELSVH